MVLWQMIGIVLGIVAAIIGIAWAVDAWLLPKPIIRPWILRQLRSLKRVPSGKDFDIRPIQSLGENIFHIDKKGEVGGLDEFFVKVHFNLWTKYTLEIINIQLSYDLPVAMLTAQMISIDRPQNVYEEVDSSYRMKERRKIGKGTVSNTFVSRRFICNYAAADHADYGTVTLDFEVASPAWEGIKALTVKGKLNPGGRLDVSEVSLHDDT